MVFTLITAGSVQADLDVNAVAGAATLGGVAAPAGTVIVVRDQTSGHTTTTQVDGPNVPPFQRGQGKFDTGDVPQFSTGDTVLVSFQKSEHSGQVTKTLSAGTTTVTLTGSVRSPPSIGALPDQEGYEDVPWQLDIEPYLSDPDTPISGLRLEIYEDYVSADGFVLTFLYPEGVTTDKVQLYVSDETTTVPGFIDVTITPVNDPPAIGEIPTIALMDNSSSSADLTPFISDPDDERSSLVLSVSGGELVDAWMDGFTLRIWAPESQVGSDLLTITATDPHGLKGHGLVTVDVAMNLTRLSEFYQGQIDELNGLISNLTGENANLTSQVEELLRDVLQLEAHEADLQSELSAALSDAADLIVELDGLRHQRGQDAEAIARLEDEKQNLSYRIEALQDELEETLAEYTATIANLEERKDEYSAQVEVLSGAILSLEGEIARMEAEANHSRLVVQNLTAERTALSAEIAEKEAEISSLSELASNLSSQVANLVLEKTRAEEAMASLEESLASMKSQNDQLRDTIEELTDKSPAQQVNGTVNTSKMGEPTAMEGIFGAAARLARGSMRVLGEGLDSTAALAILAVIAIVSGVVIAARSSWGRMGMADLGSHSSTRELWRSIESKTAAGGGDSRTASRTRVPISSVSTTSAKPRVFPVTPSSKPKVAEGPDTFVKVKKSARPSRATRTSPPKPARKVVASHRPVSLARTGAITETPKATPVGSPPASRARKDVGKETDAREPTPRPPTRRPDDITPPAKVVAQGAPPEARSPELSGLSEVDREYIKTLIEMGYAKEAEEELRKRTSGSQA